MIRKDVETLNGGRQWKTRAVDRECWMIGIPSMTGIPKKKKKKNEMMPHDGDIIESRKSVTSSSGVII